MTKKIRTALLSVFYKDGLEPIARKLHELEVTLYSTGGTQTFIENLGIPSVPVESLTAFPSILGGRVKTLHPLIFGGILGRRDQQSDIREMAEFQIPTIDLVIVDLYPFEETVSRITSDATGDTEQNEKAIIEKIDIGGPSMIRAAAKNFKDVVVLGSRSDYAAFEKILQDDHGNTSLEQRRLLAGKAFQIVMNYDIAISNYFIKNGLHGQQGEQFVLRYGENPHQAAVYYGDLTKNFIQLHGKELSYNNLVDTDAAIQLIREFDDSLTFAIIKHTNVCGISCRITVQDAWKAALAGDPESAFGGVLICNHPIDRAAAQEINEIFFEVLIAPSFEQEALLVLQTKKNRILLQLDKSSTKDRKMHKTILQGLLSQDIDDSNFSAWEEVGGRTVDAPEKEDLIFANLVCKHLKSNAIAIVRNKQLIGKGCGQTSRIDALRQAIGKAKQFHFDLENARLASDAFFPFDDCVRIAHEYGITSFIQPGGSVRDKDSISYCVQHGLAMILTGTRHFRH